MAIKNKVVKCDTLAQAYKMKAQADLRPDILSAWVNRKATPSGKFVLTCKCKVVDPSEYGIAQQSSVSQRVAFLAGQARKHSDKAKPMATPSILLGVDSSLMDEEQHRMRALERAMYQDDTQAKLASEITIDQYGATGTTRTCHYINAVEAKDLRKAGIRWYYYRADAEKAARSWIKGATRKAGNFCIVWKEEEIYYLAFNRYAVDAIDGKICWIFRRHKQLSPLAIGWSCEDSVTRDHCHWAVEATDPASGNVVTFTIPAYEANTAVKRVLDRCPGFQIVDCKEVDSSWADHVPYDTVESFLVDDYERDYDPLNNDVDISSVSNRHGATTDKGTFKPDQLSDMSAAEVAELVQSSAAYAEVEDISGVMSFDS